MSWSAAIRTRAQDKGHPATGYYGSLMLRLGTHAGISARIDELRVSKIQRTTFK